MRQRCPRCSQGEKSREKWSNQILSCGQNTQGAIPQRESGGSKSRTFKGVSESHKAMSCLGNDGFQHIYRYMRFRPYTVSTVLSFFVSHTSVEAEKRSWYQHPPPYFAIKTAVGNNQSKTRVQAMYSPVVTTAMNANTAREAKAR